MNLELTKRRLQILDETLAIYNSSNRCVNEFGACMYWSKQNPLGCAVGRLIEDKALCRYLNRFGAVNNANNEFFELLPPDVQSLGMGYLSDIQILHDNRINWDDAGPTKSGVNWSACIRLRYSLYIIT